MSIKGISLRVAGERYGIKPKTLQCYCSYGYLPETACFKTSKNGHWRINTVVCDQLIKEHGYLAIKEVG